MPFDPERYRDVVDDWPAFAEAIRRPLPRTVRVNRLRIGPREARAWLEAEGFTVRAVPWDGDLFRLEPRPGAGEPPGPGRLLATLAGLIHVQEEVSLLPVRLLDPRPGERVLDLCAAPGSKAAALAGAMEGRGTVVANDVDWRRLSSLGRNLERLGAVNSAVTCYDAANFPFAAGPFDRVLADVPCTCEGTSRKNPEVFTWGDAASRADTVRVQRAILRKAVRLVRPGGRVVYSTCTYAPEENEAVVDAVLGEASRGGPALRLLEAGVEGFSSAPGLPEWRGERFDPAVRRALRAWPHHGDTGGFFVAVLERDGAEEAPAAAAEPEALEGVDDGPWLDPVRERFGLPEEVFAGTRLVPRGRGVLALVADNLRPPRHPAPSSVGLGFLHAGMRNPKLTTAAALAVGAAATRNVVELEQEELRAYLARRDQELPAGRAESCTGGGYVLVRHRGASFGVGWLRPAPAGGRASLRSLFPKRW